MSRYVSEKLRNEVEIRAKETCEYCRIAVEDTYFGGEIDHIISFKHRGKTESENLALACQPCNRNKGSDLGSVSETSKTLIRFFNPRTDEWNEHFRVNSDAEIEFLTEIGEVTAFIFGFNDLERIAERKGLIEIGHY
ncbi:MAG: HNH endonuclease [Pyrinomonadaceae bacterium]|nr:HNH endonuclease [Pyrinomonadaceae bacterium]